MATWFPVLQVNFMSSFYTFDMEPDCGMSFDPVPIWSPLQCTNSDIMTHSCLSTTSDAIHVKNVSLAFKVNVEDKQKGDNAKGIQMEMISNIKITQCSKLTELPCNPGKDESCFNMSDMCAFRLDEENLLFPCKSGGHIELCTKFECNQKYKCTGFYCLPFGYVCNGRWDCPSGDDEIEKHGCGQNRLCFNMFKCRESQICVGIRDVCDGLVDCANFDDEFLCDLKYVKCPESCLCTNYAISCNKQSLHRDNLQRKMPFIVLSLSSIQISSCDFLTGWKQIKLIHMSENSLREVCCTVGISHSNLISFVAPKNEIYKLSQNCFAHLKKLHTIHLMNNKISILHQKSFHNLSQIWSIDLSCNQIDTLQKFVFFILSNLKVLSVKGNPISAIYPSPFDKFDLISLSTDNHQLCCFVSSPFSCSTTEPVYMHCSDLFPKASMTAMVSVWGSIIVFINILSLCIFIGSSAGAHKEKQVPFFITVCAINMSDFICGIFFLLLLHAHKMYQKAYIFNEKEWRGTFQCLTVFVLSLIFAFSSAVLLVILSLSRCMVVKNPVDSIFKQRSTVKNIVGISNISVLLFGLVIGIIQKIVYCRMPMILCSPVADPTHRNILITIFTHIISWFHTLCFTAVITLNFLLIHTRIRKSIISKSKKTSDSGTMAQLTLMSLSNLICWIPTSIIFMVSFFLSEYPVDLVIWATILLTPINSVLNPLIFLAVHVKNHISIKYI